MITTEVRPQLALHCRKAAARWKCSELQATGIHEFCPSRVAGPLGAMENLVCNRKLIFSIIIQIKKVRGGFFC